MWIATIKSEVGHAANVAHGMIRRADGVRSAVLDGFTAHNTAVNIEDFHNSGTGTVSFHAVGVFIRFGF